MVLFKLEGQISFSNTSFLAQLKTFKDFAIIACQNLYTAIGKEKEGLGEQA